MLRCIVTSFQRLKDSTSTIDKIYLELRVEINQYSISYGRDNSFVYRVEYQQPCTTLKDDALFVIMEVYYQQSQQSII